MADVPMYLQEQTEENILNRMLAKVPSDIDKSEGSFIWDAQAPVAFLLSEAALWAQELLRRGFASTAASDSPDIRSAELDLRTAEHGVTRRDAVASSGGVVFTGKPGTNVPKGTYVATPADETTGESSVEYVTTASVTLGQDGTGTAPIRAVTPGKSGNVPAGVIQLLMTSVSGVTSVTNPEPTRSGTDVETDQSLLERFYAKVRSQGTSGNKAQYMQWASEIPGVGGVEVAPCGPDRGQSASICWTRTSGQLARRSWMPSSSISTRRRMDKGRGRPRQVRSSPSCLPRKSRFISRSRCSAPWNSRPRLRKSGR